MLFSRDHTYITSAKDWVGESRKFPVWLTFSTVFMLINTLKVVGFVGGLEKAQIYADVNVSSCGLLWCTMGIKYLSILRHMGAFTNYVYKIWLFLTTYPPPFTFSMV